MSESEFLARLTEALRTSYRLQTEIGRGGTAIVFAAADLRHHRTVAVKVLRPEVSALVGGDRFLREIEIAGNLQHPNIVPVYDSGRANGHLYYVMPHVEGTSLREHLRKRGALSIEDAVLIAREVGDALAYAHAHGVVHRDVKPGNILLTSHHAMVADFGVACAMADVDSRRLTESGIVLGTPAYMSPEQTGGEGEIDGRCDVYALGCVLFEMLAGEPPFTGRTAQAVLARHLLEPAPSVEIVRPNVPTTVAEAVRRSLEKLPADRFDTAASFVEALEHSRPPLSARRRFRWRRHRRALVVTSFVAVAALATWLLTPWAAAPALDASRVAIFPLATESSVPEHETAGIEAMLLLASSLQYAPDVRCVNGSRLLTQREQQSLSLLTPQAVMEAARRARIRYAAFGTIRGRADRQEVSLQLLDAQGDSTVARASVAHPADSVPLAWTTLAAAERLWMGQAAITPPDLGSLLERAPESVASLSRGLRLYRTASFADALATFREALEADSSFALAAFHGGQAALWLEGSELSGRYARVLFETALRRPDLLPEKYVLAARGLVHHLVGHADSASLWLHRALEADSAWTEGWLALGEVYYHLLPAEEPLDSLAEHAMRRALELDPEFSPAMFHLAEIEIRRGRLDRADSLLSAYRSFEPDSLELRQLELMIDCVRNRPSTLEWTETLDAGHSLAGGGYQPWCAEQAFRAVLHAADAPRGHQWGAILGLHALMVAQGHDALASSFLDSLFQAGWSTVQTLYVLGALAGADMQDAADRSVTVGDEAFGPGFEGVHEPWLWMFGTWFAYRGELDKAARVLASLDAAAGVEGGEPATRVYADAVAAHLALARGDTLGAIARLRALRPRAPLGDLVWGMADALAYERMVLARLLYATGEPEEAYLRAGALDHPGPITFVEFLPGSLALRHRIASELGWRERAALLEQRLARLDREELIRPPEFEPPQGEP